MAWFTRNEHDVKHGPAYKACSPRFRENEYARVNAVDAKFYRAYHAHCVSNHGDNGWKWCKPHLLLQNEYFIHALTASCCFLDCNCLKASLHMTFLALDVAELKFESL